jgi:hypothetical protein
MVQAAHYRLRKSPTTLGRFYRLGAEVGQLYGLSGPTAASAGERTPISKRSGLCRGLARRGKMSRAVLTRSPHSFFTILLGDRVNTARERERSRSVSFGPTGVNLPCRACRSSQGPSASAAGDGTLKTAGGLLCLPRPAVQRAQPRGSLPARNRQQKCSRDGARRAHRHGKEPA